jgi:hypothetical protein
VTRAILILAVALLLASPLAAQMRIERPPPAYRGDATVTVHFVADVQAACEAWGVRFGVMGCASPVRNAIIVPLACAYRGEFADLVCHEVAHLLGWVHPPPLGWGAGAVKGERP